MNIALYHPWIYVKSGLERTILEIVRRSRHNWILYTSHYDKEGTYPELKNYEIIEMNRVSVKRQYGAVAVAAYKIATTKLDLTKADALVVCCDGLGSFVTIRNRELPILNLCFTPLRAVYDKEYRKRHIKKHARLRLIALLAEKVFVPIDRILWRNYRKVVCISRTVRKRVIDANLYPIENMEVAYTGISGENIRASEQFEPFFFLPGRIMWTKNIELVIEGFLKFRRSTQKPFKLLIAGMVDDKSKVYYRKLKELSAESSDIEFHLNPSDEMMRQWYKRCYCTLFTAFNEDLGLTPMEAMAFGKPVIAVDKGGPREVVDRDRTGLLIPPDPRRFADAMRWLVDNPDKAKKMGRAGMSRVKGFTWEEYVKTLDNILDGMANDKAVLLP